MVAIPQAQRLRVIINESDKLRHRSMAEQIIQAAHQAGLSGATAFRGSMSFGASAHFHSSHVLDLANDLPLAIEIVASTAALQAFLAHLEGMLNTAGCGALISLEEISAWQVISRKGESA